ncbi:MAG: transcriptional regulator [Alphaproteobacteria bacterium]|nr:transcriptional regulator [Alphaproteobacteria bacterium]
MIRNPDALSATFAALADPTRRAIVARLSAGEATVGEVARPFALALPTVSRHLKVLEQAGLIRRETDAQWRRCRLLTEPLDEAGEWVERTRAFWESNLDSLAAYFKPQRKPAKKRRARRRKGDPKA